MRKMILALVVAAALLAALAVPLLGGGQAFADPVRNPEAFVLTVNCGGESFDVVGTPGAASQALASTGVGVTHALTFRFYVNNQLVLDESVTRGRGRGLDILLTCSFDEEFMDPAGNTIRIEGEGQVLDAPRGG